MANKAKHAQRSGYSSHQAKPYSMFEQRARMKKAKKDMAAQERVFRSAVNTAKANFFRKKGER